VDRLLARLVSRAIRRGLGGEPIWLAVGAGLWLVRRARKRGDETIWSGRIQAGQSLQISAYDPRTPSEGVAVEG